MYLVLAIPGAVVSRSALIVAVLLSTACSFASRPVEPGRFAILPEQEAQALVRQCSRSAPGIEGTWSVTDEDASSLEHDLPKLRRFKANRCCFMGGRIHDLDSYLRQYVGVTIGGRRYIYINAFTAGPLDDRPGSNAAPPRWKEVAFTVCDGGTGHWGALYDPATRRFTELAINGSA